MAISMVDNSLSPRVILPLFVIIPLKAGIQKNASNASTSLDSRLYGNDSS